MDERESLVFAVPSTEHGGQALAGYLSLKGFTVYLFNRTPERILSIKLLGGIQVEGEVSGFAPIARVTTDIKEAISGARVLMVVTPATGHREIAERLSPYLEDGQIIVLNPGRTGGALEVRQVLKETSCKKGVIIAEAQTFLFASRICGPAQVHIFRIKNSIPVAAIPAHQTFEVTKTLRNALPQFVPEDNVLRTSFNNIGAVFHPTITILNAARIESTHGEFNYYIDGVTPSVALILEEVDRERVQVAEALGIRAITLGNGCTQPTMSTGEISLRPFRTIPDTREFALPQPSSTVTSPRTYPQALYPLLLLERCLVSPHQL